MKASLAVYYLSALLTPEEVGIPKAGGGDDSGLISSVLNPVYFWAGVVATIVIIVAGFIYATASGEAAKLTRAKNAILGACIGLALILGAFVITNFVIGAVK